VFWFSLNSPCFRAGFARTVTRDTGLRQKLHAFTYQFIGEEGHAGHVCSRSRKTLDKPALDRITVEVGSAPGDERESLYMLSVEHLL
jgi:hypothetical protein